MPSPTDIGGVARDYFALLKPRVMSLVVFTALVGMVHRAGGASPSGAGVLRRCCAIAVGAGAAGALNMWYDADIDAVMRAPRTVRFRGGALLPGEALAFGLDAGLRSR